MDSIETQDAIDSIAIIGMGGRFPGATSVDQFWQNLIAGVESIDFFTDEELADLGIDPSLLNDPNYVKAGTVLPDIDMFDASFFGLTPKEAAVTSPQHRLFLECAWEALENAGYNPEAYDGQIGVYAGANENTYWHKNLLSNQDLLKSAGSMVVDVGNQPYTLTTQVSYKLNLTGPSVNVNTACSTSLVAVHMGCQSLLNYQCDIAIAGGISIQTPQKEGYLYEPGGICSADGHCRAFDANAGGTIFTNGAGIVVLKRLEEAIAEGDCIYAVIKGSAINNDGAIKVGFTAPSIDGQASAIVEAMNLAEIDPETISYIEAHGTGTALGDPIEIAALTQAFRDSTQKQGFCAIGSVKTNIGHLNTAAGVAGLIKTVLSLKHKLLPATLHFEQLNPKIEANNPFYVNTELSEWQTDGTPRRAGVSSFGIGGTNAHVVLEEAPTLPPSGTSRPWQLLVLSAKTSSALDKLTKNLAEHLGENPTINLADLAYTLQLGRQPFNYRRMLVCQNQDDAFKTLTSLDSKRVITNLKQQEQFPVIFMFSGQGSQYVNMGRELYEVEPTFREQVDICCELLKPHLGLDLRHLLYPSESQAEVATQQLTQTAITQAALFVIEYALAKLWIKFGISPQGMIGHSIGEYVAACFAGVFSLEDALALVAVRGQLMQQLPSGSMLAVPLPQAEIQPFLGPELSVAVINGPSLCVVSGIAEAVAVLKNQLAARGIDCRLLHTSHAFHSAMMEPILEVFTERVKQINLRSPQIPYISNVTGTWITADQATDPSYWALHLRQTVRFASGLSQIFQNPETILLEVGPGRTLSTLAMRHPDKLAEQLVFTSVRHPQDRKSDLEFLLTTLGQLWLTGVEVDWSGFSAFERRHRVPLPTYPFERQRHWVDPQPNSNMFSGGGKTAPASSLFNKKPDIADWFYIPSWKLSPPINLQPGKSNVYSGWIVFLDESGLGEGLVQKLKQQDQETITIKVGSEFARIGDRSYTLNPSQPDHYDALLKELNAQNLIYPAIAHLWSITTENQPELTLESCAQAQDLGFHSLLFLAQAIKRQNFQQKFRLTVISNNLHQVTGEELLRPEKVTVLGATKVIPQELPNITCHNIDVVIAALESQEKLIEQLLEELQTESAESVVAYRQNRRWLQSFEPVCLEPPTEPTASLREGGVYLITGGLGPIGFMLAEHLAKNVNAKLILTGRSALPPQNEWNQWLDTHEPQDNVSHKLQKLQKLKNLGAEVLVLRADVANQQQMELAISKAERQFGHINGVIHAASVFTERASGFIENITQDEVTKEFYPKVQGLMVLDKIFGNQELDFCLLMSSLSSVLGGMGFAAHSAANLFMDVFVNQFPRINSSWLSINWDRWYIEDIKEQNIYVESTLAELAISPPEALDALQRVLSIRKIPQVIVSTGDLQSRAERWIKPESLREINHTSARISQVNYARPNLRNVYLAPTNQVEQTLANLWQSLLGIEQVGINDNFFELGGHSLLAIQLFSQINHSFGIELTMDTIFKSPTVAELAVIIEQNSSTTQEELSQMEQMLQLVENMSEEEIEALLNEA